MGLLHIDPAKAQVTHSHFLATVELRFTPNHQIMMHHHKDICVNRSLTVVIHEESW